ncbi:hypothetical protein CYFUS_001084 [Cystobacter fuscus]|uniref:Head protein n=1 Tax=Cystobacter fuscus TaxID=43 RepID=A0A250IWM8_9BACT|nr:head protein [Cystobacter fuscus]ATB35670.1 hypothetical protein CYFUS_001084 [Cystobacter fuscus]
MTIFDQIIEAQELLGKSREHAQSLKEKELFLLAIDALWFVWRNGQSHEFESYRKDVESKAPDRVIATFNTRDEAYSWLGIEPKPSDLAYVLIADEYHVIMTSRDGKRSSLVPHPALELHIEEMMRDGLPPAAAIFNTREEADTWFDSQAEPPVQTVIQIGGERYLAVYYRNINHRAIYPFSIARRLEKKEGPGE